MAAAQSIAELLDRCLEEIEAGRATIEECLERNPGFREQLEPLLRIATGISAFTADPDPLQKAASRERFLSALASQRVTGGRQSYSPQVERPATVRSPSLTAVPTLAEVLDACVEDILAGRATVDDCLAQYPDLRSELEPLLRVVTWINPLALSPDPALKLAARARFIEALYAEPEVRGIRGWVVAFLDQAASFRFGLPGNVSLVVALALVTSSGAVYAAEQALPGAPLYGVKLAVEQVRLAAAVDDESKVQVELDIASRRLAEVERALQLGDQNAVQAAATRYSATVQDTEARIERLAERSDPQLTEKLEANLDRHQRVLATAVAQAPPSAKQPLEEARSNAERGLDRAIAAFSKGDGRDAGSANRAARAVSGSPGTAIVQPVGAVPPARTFTPLPTEIARQVDDLEQQVLDLSVPANSAQGLLAKLSAVETVLRRGQVQAAENQLGALRNELDALRRTNRITESEYQSLNQAAIDLGAAIEQSVPPRRSEREPPGGRPEERLAATATPRPTVASIEGRPRNQVEEFAPTVAVPTESRTDNLPGRGQDSDRGSENRDPDAGTRGRDNDNRERDTDSRSPDVDNRGRNLPTSPINVAPTTRPASVPTAGVGAPPPSPQPPSAANPQEPGNPAPPAGPRGAGGSQSGRQSDGSSSESQTGQERAREGANSSDRRASPSGTSPSHRVQADRSTTQSGRPEEGKRT